MVFIDKCIMLMGCVIEVFLLFDYFHNFFEFRSDRRMSVRASHSNLQNCYEFMIHKSKAICNFILKYKILNPLQRKLKELVYT